MSENLTPIQQAALKSRRQRQRMKSFCENMRRLRDFRSQHSGDAETPAQVADLHPGQMNDAAGNIGAPRVRYTDTLALLRRNQLITDREHRAGEWAQALLQFVHGRANIRCAEMEAAQRGGQVHASDDAEARAAENRRIAKRLQAVAEAHQGWALVFAVMVEGRAVRDFAGGGKRDQLEKQRLARIIAQYADIYDDPRRGLAQE